MTMYAGDETNGDEVTSGTFTDFDDRSDMIASLLSTGEFTLALLQILDDYELAELCDEYGV